MTLFADLDEQLALVAPDDYWSDEGVVYALELAGDLSPEGWADLSRRWPDRPVVWQLRCAEVLADVAQEPAVEVLAGMIGSPADEVAIQAADSLRAILESNPDLVIPAAALPRAERLVPRVRGVLAQSLDQLISQLRNRQ